MTTGQQDGGAPSQTEASSGPGNCYCGGPEEAVYGHPYGSGYYCRRKTAASQVDAVRAAEVPPLAELVVRVDLTPTVAAQYGGTPRWLGPETALGGRPLVGRGEADVMDPQDAARAEWAYRRARAWRGDQVTTEDAE